MADFKGEYWLIAVPHEDKSSDRIYSEQRQKLSRFAEVHEFKMPSLRVSAVDELVTLNEKLMKYDVFARSVVLRLVRNYREFMDQPDAIPNVKDRQLYRYIPTFAWQRGNFSTRSKLPQLSDDIHERLVTTHDRLKTMLDRYKQVKSKLQTDERANQGNLMVCSLQKYVKPADYVDGEYITTALVVVPVNKQAEFESNYWQLEQTEEAQDLWRREMSQKQKLMEMDVENEDKPDKKINYKKMDMPMEERKKMEVVAPDSAELLEKQKDFCLYRVVLLKKGYKWFKDIAREFRYTVRDFEYKNEDTQEMEEADREKLVKEEYEKKKRILMFCNHSFPDALEQWLHLKMVRVFIEGVLRYGPGDNESAGKFTTSILQVNNNMGSPLAALLQKMYQHLESQDMAAGEDDGMAMMGMTELRPYVFIPLMATFD